MVYYVGHYGGRERGQRLGLALVNNFNGGEVIKLHVSSYDNYKHSKQ